MQQTLSLCCFYENRAKTEMFNVKKPENCIALLKEVVESLHYFLERIVACFFPTENVKISGLFSLYKDYRIFCNKKTTIVGQIENTYLSYNVVSQH